MADKGSQILHGLTGWQLGTERQKASWVVPHLSGLNDSCHEVTISYGLMRWKVLDVIPTHL